MLTAIAVNLSSLGSYHSRQRRRYPQLRRAAADRAPVTSRSLSDPAEVPEHDQTRIAQPGGGHGHRVAAETVDARGHVGWASHSGHGPAATLEQVPHGRFRPAYVVSIHVGEAGVVAEGPPGQHHG